MTKEITLSRLVSRHQPGYHTEHTFFGIPKDAVDIGVLHDDPAVRNEDLWGSFPRPGCGVDTRSHHRCTSARCEQITLPVPIRVAVNDASDITLTI